MVGTMSLCGGLEVCGKICYTKANDLAVPLIDCQMFFKYILVVSILDKCSIFEGA